MSEGGIWSKENPLNVKISDFKIGDEFESFENQKMEGIIEETLAANIYLISFIEIQKKLPCRL